MGHDGRVTLPSRRTLALAAVLLAVCIAAWPLLSDGGLLNTRGGGDSPFLLQRLHQLELALADGHFPVRWMPDANYGFGYPFFNYYAPLSIYVAVVFRLLGFGYVHAIQLAQGLGFLVAAWATFRLATRWLESEWAGLLAAVAYSVAPFHMVNVYVRGDSLAEFWAMALYPLVLLASDDLMTADGAQRRAAALLALSYAALILTHNISALIFSPFLLLYLLLRSRRSARSFLVALRAPTLALTLGLALSASFWLPALAETTLVQMEPVTSGYFHFGNHFWDANLVQPSFFFDYDVAGRNAFRMGLVQTAVIVAGVLALLWHWRRQRDAGSPSPGPPSAGPIFIGAAFLVATFMITSLSRPLWEALPLLPFTQFPWRFLSVQALAGAILTGALALVPIRDRFRAGLALTAAALLVVTALGRLETDHLAITDDEVTAERLAQYEWFTGNIGSTVSAEYLPHTVQPRPYTSAWIERGARNRAQIVAGQATAQLTERQATTQTWEVTAGDGGATIVLPTLHWPGWTAVLDGAATASRPATGSGLVSLDVPAGAHTLTLSLGRTPVRLAAEWLSLAAVVLAGAVFVVGSGAPSGGGRPHLLARLSGLWFFLLPILLLALFLGLRSAPASEKAPQTWDFAQMAYLHPDPGGVHFDGGARLEGYDYETESVGPGETLEVTVAWAATGGEAATATLALVTPAVHRFQHAPSLFAHSRPLSPGATIYTLPIPEDAPAGLYAPRLTVEGATPLLASGQSRGALFLRPVRITEPDVPEADGGRPRPLQVRADNVSLAGHPPAIGAGSGLFDCASGRPAASRLLLHLSWRTATPLSRNLTASLRLVDAAGLELAQCDVQPGYGYRPSSLWPAGQWVDDLLALPLPDRLSPAAPYGLVVRLYDAQGDTALTRRLGEVVWEEETLLFRPTQPNFALPPEATSAAAFFGDVIGLRGYRLEQEAGTLALTLYWEALAAGQDDFVRFVHLVDPATGQIVQRFDGTTVQVDSIPRNGSYPTSQWLAGEIVADPVTLGSEGVPAGTYRVAVGFYPAQEPADRLPATGPQGQALPDNHALLPETVPVGR